MKKYITGIKCFGCDEDTNIHSDEDTAQMVEDIMMEEDNREYGEFVHDREDNRNYYDDKEYLLD